MTGNFGQIFLGHEECWRLSCVFLFSQLVACRWAGKTQTTPHLGTPSPPWIRTTPLIYCCVRRMHHVPVSILLCLWVVFTVLTFLQRNTHRNAGCNRKLLNEKNGDSMCLLGNQDSAQKLNLFGKSLNWCFPAPDIISPSLCPSRSPSSSLSLSWASYGSHMVKLTIDSWLLFLSIENVTGVCRVSGNLTSLPSAAHVSGWISVSHPVLRQNLLSKPKVQWRPRQPAQRPTEPWGL